MLFTWSSAVCQDTINYSTHKEKLVSGTYADLTGLCCYSVNDMLITTWDIAIILVHVSYMYAETGVHEVTAPRRTYMFG